jgi:hypothetical protein
MKHFPIFPTSLSICSNYGLRAVGYLCIEPVRKEGYTFRGGQIADRGAPSNTPPTPQIASCLVKQYLKHVSNGHVWPGGFPLPSLYISVICWLREKHYSSFLFQGLIVPLETWVQNRGLEEGKLTPKNQKWSEFRGYPKGQSLLYWLSNWNPDRKGIRPNLPRMSLAHSDQKSRVSAPRSVLDVLSSSDVLWSQ